MSCSECPTPYECALLRIDGIQGLASYKNPTPVGAYQSRKFQTFDCSSEISPNLYFDRLLLLEVCKISAKKVKRTLKSDAKLKKKKRFPS